MAEESFISTVRKRPTEIRRMYAFAFAIGTMAVVVAIWLLGVNESFRRVATDAPELGSEIKARVAPKVAVPPSISSLLEEGKKLTIPERPDYTAGERLFEEQLETRESMKAGGAGSGELPAAR